MKITIHLLLLALCVLAARVRTQPTPVPDVSEFDSEVELSEAGENAAEAAEEGAAPIGGTTEPEGDSDSSSEEEEPSEIDGTDAPDADTTPPPLGGIAGAGAGTGFGNNAMNANDAAEAAAGDSSGSVLGMKARDHSVRAGGFSATAVGVATTLGIVGAVAAAAGIIVYIKKK